MPPRQYPGGLYEGQVLNSAVPVMRFTLVYDGPLPATGDGKSSRRIKHEIREQLHAQLREVWLERPSLRGYLKFYRENPSQAQSPEPIPPTEGAAANLYPDGYLSGILVPFSRGAFTFVPLATKKYHLVCHLDILFLRAEPPGSLFTNNAGDLDNRLKLLFDALRVPTADELPPDAAPGDRNPFFCLLQDDCLITGLHVDSERLLDVPEKSSHVKLVVRVTIKTRAVSLLTMPLEGD